jgi:hypothetical protein
MSKENRTEDQEPRHQRVRKPYLKPGFEREQLFETMAMTCGKVQSTQASCRTNRKNS